ncbi:hypothetical protein FACS1894133_2450 [Clostridia bacterium]|nr:hypothetical protein FACS1894133_2450 [Clostridia bacterium]
MLLIVLSIVIIIHEVGHFVTARLFKIKISEFAFGIGPIIFKRKFKRTDTTYTLRAIPIGAYVTLNDDNDFTNTPIWQRIIFTLAGGFVNIVIGLIICVVIKLDFIHMFTESFYYIARGGNFIGPIVILYVTFTNLYDFLVFVSILSLEVGLLSVLPIPGLDGAKAMLLAIEGLRKKPVNPKVEGIISLAGLSLFISLLIMLTLNDIKNFIIL